MQLNSLAFNPLVKRQAFALLGRASDERNTFVLSTGQGYVLVGAFVMERATRHGLDGQWITDFAVVPRFRGRGIGLKLLKAAVAVVEDGPVLAICEIPGVWQMFRDAGFEHVGAADARPVKAAILRKISKSRANESSPVDLAPDCVLADGAGC